MKRVTAPTAVHFLLLLSISGVFPVSPAPLAHEPSPKVFQAIYLTYWSAGTKSRVDRVIDMARSDRINAVVIDLKDAEGTVAYDARVPAAAEYGARRPIIRDVDALVERLHQAGLYVIARIVIFQDPVLARARPDLAVHSVSKMAEDTATLTVSTLWLDRKKLAWIDPAAKGAWEYNVAIARDALSRGFDEINFDYVRFPSDGNLHDMYFPAWDGKTPKHVVIRGFFAYLRQQLAGSTISADLFGLTTVKHDALGVGQMIEDAYEYFDYVCPMVYPSHYAVGFLGKQNPAEYPYEVVYHSMKSARERLLALDGARSELRPWLQDFNLGAIYDADMVKSQIRAVQDALGPDYRGYVLWSPSNVYTLEAISGLTQVSRR
jgi:hypothetical protein